MAGQAGASVEFGVSFTSALIGDEILTKHIADPEFMKQENWAAELTSRVCRAVVAQAVCEGHLAILTAHELPRAYRRRSLGLGPRSSRCSETLERAAL